MFAQLDHRIFRMGLSSKHTRLATVHKHGNHGTLDSCSFSVDEQKSQWSFEIFRNYCKWIQREKNMKACTSCSEPGLDILMLQNNTFGQGH